MNYFSSNINNETDITIQKHLVSLNGVQPFRLLYVDAPNGFIEIKRINLNFQSRKRIN